MVVGGRELIDTLWNVNSVFPRISPTTNRINRYIMECKFAVIFFGGTAIFRINRYIMECKCCLVCIVDTCVSRINRYIMECK